MCIYGNIPCVILLNDKKVHTLEKNWLFGKKYTFKIYLNCSFSAH